MLLPIMVSTLFTSPVVIFREKKKLIGIVHLLVLADHKINVNAQINEGSNAHLALRHLLANKKIKKINVIAEDRMVYLVKLIIDSTNVNGHSHILLHSEIDLKEKDKLGQFTIH